MFLIVRSYVQNEEWIVERVYMGLFLLLAVK